VQCIALRIKFAILRERRKKKIRRYFGCLVSSTNYACINQSR